MTTPDPRREATPPSDSGWLHDQVDKSVASLDSLPPKLRASLAQPTTRRGHHMTTINDEAVRAAIDAAFPGLPAGMTLDEAERRMRAGLAAALVASGWRPEADVLREAADHFAAHWYDRGQAVLIARELRNHAGRATALEPVGALPVAAEQLEPIKCSRCGKPVSRPMPADVVVRAWVECPECAAGTPAEGQERSEEQRHG